MEKTAVRRASSSGLGKLSESLPGDVCGSHHRLFAITVDPGRALAAPRTRDLPRAISKPHLTRIATVAALLLLWEVPVYGYLDPGTSSIILQGLLAGLAGLLLVLKLYWRRFKALFSARRGGTRTR
jgi:hypothetical protein